MLRSPISRATILASACLLAIAPFLWWGSPSGHDFEFHIFSWMEVLGQWKHGIVYPRWAALAHWGYGEARFLFYPPASWTLGAALGSILPWKMVPAAYCWIVLMFSGYAMYRLAREWLGARDALFAAVFYALNPYHLLIVYWRSAYAELLAAALLPLLLLCLLRLKDPGIRPVLWLSVTLAAGWLTNAPVAVMIHYSTAGLALFMSVQVAWRERSVGQEAWRPLAGTAAAMLIGAGLASFYLIPAIYEQGWVNLSEVLSPGVRPQDNFLFTTINDPDHNRFNSLLSIVALSEIGVLAVAIFFARPSKPHVGTAARSTGSGQAPGCPAAPNRVGGAKENAWLLLSTWGAASTLLMLSVSNLLWQHLPKFRFVQLPFRWLLCMNAALAVLLTMAVRRWPVRLLASAALLGIVIFAGHRIQPPWWDQAGDIREMSNAIADRSGYEGTDEYVPAGADAYELNKSLPLVSYEDNAATPIRTQGLEWTPAAKHFAVHSTTPKNLVVRLFNYPAWSVAVNGVPIATQTTDVTGLIVIPVTAGDNDVRIDFLRTNDRRVGNIVSLISVAIFILAWYHPAWRYMRRPRLPAKIESLAA